MPQEKHRISRDNRIVISIASLPVSIRVTVDSGLVHEVLSRSLLLLARIRITSVELARSIFNICEEIIAWKVPEAVVVINDLIEVKFNFYNTTVLQEFGLGCVRGNEPVPAAAQVHFLAAFIMFDEPHLASNVADHASSVLETFTSLQYGFLFKSWPFALRALYIRML